MLPWYQTKEEKEIEPNNQDLVVLAMNNPYKLRGVIMGGKPASLERTNHVKPEMLLQLSDIELRRFFLHKPNKDHYRDAIFAELAKPMNKNTKKYQEILAIINPEN